MLRMPGARGPRTGSNDVEVKGTDPSIGLARAGDGKQAQCDSFDSARLEVIGHQGTQHELRTPLPATQSVIVAERQPPLLSCSYFAGRGA